MTEGYERFLTLFHKFRTNANTRYYFVGTALAHVDHVCNKRVKKLLFYQPMEKTASAAYCSECNCCYFLMDHPKDHNGQESPVSQ